MQLVKDVAYALLLSAYFLLRSDTTCDIIGQFYRPSSRIKCSTNSEKQTCYYTRFLGPYDKILSQFFYFLFLRRLQDVD